MLKTVSSISNVIGALNFKGTWNAATNTPTLASGVGTKGDYYYVSVAGNTNLDGITDWQVTDLAVFNGSQWQKIDNTDQVLSVNGQQGVVVLPTMSEQNADNVAITGGTIEVANLTAANVTVTANLFANLVSSASAAMPDPSLPLNPEGYVSIVINGATKKVPFTECDVALQDLLNLIGGIGLTALGWFGRELWSAVKELKTDLAKLREELPKTYAQKDDVKEDFKEIKQMLTDIYQELRKKADK